jgi:hypothetical protein
VKDLAATGRTPAHERDEHGQEKPNLGRHPMRNEIEKGASIGGAQNQEEWWANSNSRALDDEEIHTQPDPGERYKRNEQRHERTDS